MCNIKMQPLRLHFLLLEFNLELKHVPGKDNAIVEALSRPVDVEAGYVSDRKTLYSIRLACS